MRRCAALAAVLVASACASPPVPPRVPPDALTHCAGPVAAPPRLPAVLTVPQLRAWAVATDAARRATEQARADCEAHLNALTQWIGEAPVQR